MAAQPNPRSDAGNTLTLFPPKEVTWKEVKMFLKSHASLADPPGCISQSWAPSPPYQVWLPLACLVARQIWTRRAHCQWLSKENWKYEITEHLAGNQKSKWANKNLWVQRASNRHTTILEWSSCSIQILYLPKSSDLWTSSRTKISWVNWRAKRTSSWGCGGLIVHQFFFKFLPQPCRGECLGYPGAGRTVPSQQVRRSQPQ